MRSAEPLESWCCWVFRWGCFDGQSYCPIPLPVGMQKGDQAALQRMSILCGHKSMGSPWEQAEEVMLEPEGHCRRLPRSCLLTPQCLLSFVGCKEIKGATSSLHEIISLRSLSPHPQWLLLSVIPLGSCSTARRWCSSAKLHHPWCQWIFLTICHHLSLC